MKHNYPGPEYPQVNWKPHTTPRPDNSWLLGVRLARARRAEHLRKLREREARLECESERGLQSANHHATQP